MGSQVNYHELEDEWVFDTDRVSVREPREDSKFSTNLEWLLNPRSHGKSYWNFKMFWMVFAGLVLLFAVSVMEWNFLRTETNETSERFKFEGCHNANTTEGTSKFHSRRRPLMVFMVIDAFRYQFLQDPEYLMNVTRKFIEKGTAVHFLTIARTPTVTMPRIKAMTSGVIPKFSSILGNFGSIFDSSSGDSWLDQARKAQLRGAFVGDDTWISLFPNPKQFDYTHPVPSFDVADFYQIDEDVKRHVQHNMDIQHMLRTQSDYSNHWDYMIIHFLGLDHVGHYLGPNSPELPKKLQYMDLYISSVHENLTSVAMKLGRPFVFVITGDHGMTSTGSHGGNSQLEREVPTIIFSSDAKVIKGHHWNDRAMTAEQVDIATTMSQFLNVPIPADSLGMSLFSKISKHWFIDERTLFHSLIDQARHFSRLVPGFSNIASTDLLTIVNANTSAEPETICELAENITRILSYHEGVLEEMSKKLIGSTVRWYEECVLGFYAMLAIIMIPLCFVTHPHIYLFIVWSGNSKNPVTYYGKAQFVMNCLVVCAAFGSSFAEEEHDLWYHLFALVILVRLYHTVRHAWERPTKVKCLKAQEACDRRARVKGLFCEAAVLLVLHRICVGFNAGIRRRWMMDPKLLPQSEFYTPTIITSIENFVKSLSTDWSWHEKFTVPFIGCTCVLFYCGFITVTHLHKRYSEGDIRRHLLWPAVVYLMLKAIRLGITVDNHEESVRVFMNDEKILALQILSVVFGMFASPTLTALFYLSSLVRPQYAVVVIIAFEMGIRARRLFINHYMLFFLTKATFFYMGASTTVSSIDIVPGYLGTAFGMKHLFIIGLKIGLNMYSAPFAFLLGYSLYPSPHTDPATTLNQTDFPRSTKTMKETQPFVPVYFLHGQAICFSAAVAAAVVMSDHLFIFSVFAPKIINEMAHSVVVLVGCALLAGALEVAPWTRRKYARWIEPMFLPASRRDAI